MNFNYTNDTGITVDIFNIFQAGTGTTTMTGYTVNDVNDLTFLLPFTTNTDASGDTSTYAAKIPYSNGGTQFEFCPKYRLHKGTAYYTDQTTFNEFTATAETRDNTEFSNRIIPAGVKRMLAVCIGGGGGGGGGGAEDRDDSNGESDAGGGAGGGGGAMYSRMFNIDPSVNTYSCSIGSGGMCGQPNNRSASLLKPGLEAESGNLKDGRPGKSGGNTTFTYGITTITANGGGGGGGGQSNSDTPDYVAYGGAGGAVTTSTQFRKAGTSGANTDSGLGINGNAVPGGIGGVCGNLNTTDIQGVFINKNIISFESDQWTNTGSNSNIITDLDNVSNPNQVDAFNLKFGEGGHGGMGDDNGSHYGFAGEVGAPGCVIVFFYYTYT
jgi:hypothetical protein